MLSLNLSPFPILETERLLLRCITTEDAAQLFTIRSDKKIMKFIDRQPFKSVGEAAEFIKEKVLEPLKKNDGILWMIELKEQPGTAIGNTGFWRLTKEHYRAEIGYMLQSDYWRKGIMREAVKATLDWAFMHTEIHSIEANIDPGNTGSAALLESIGFVKEAYFRENYYFNGIFKDSIIYSLVKDLHYSPTAIQSPNP